MRERATVGVRNCVDRHCWTTYSPPWGTPLRSCGGVCKDGLAQPTRPVTASSVPRTVLAAWRLGAIPLFLRLRSAAPSLLDPTTRSELRVLPPCISIPMERGIVPSSPVPRLLSGQSINHSQPEADSTEGELTSTCSPACCILLGRPNSHP